MALSDITLDTDPRATLRLMEQIDVLTMSPTQRRKLLREIAKNTRADMRKNIRNQKTVDGSAMTPRSGKSRKRMFSKMSKGMVTRVRNNHEVVITWKYGSRAKLAYRHHHGINQEVSASEASRVSEKKYGTPKYKDKATYAQAKALNKGGFRRKVARKRGKGKAVLKRVPKKWIMEKMNRGQAGLVLRLMRTKTRKGKQRWVIKSPERPILGATSADANKYLTAMAQNALQQINKV